MTVLVTGLAGKGGTALVPRLQEAGHEVRATTSPCRPGIESRPGEPEDYWQVDLTDAGSAYAVVGGCDVVVHTAAIPQPIHNPPHVVFGNNMLSTFNVLEAGDRGRREAVRELLERDRARLHLRVSALQARLPPDGRGAPRPPAGSVRDREVVRRAPLRPGRRARGHPVHVDSAVWVQDEEGATSATSADHPRSLGDHRNYCSYVDVYDLCDAVVLAIETDLPGTRSSTSHRRTRSAATARGDGREHYYGADIEFRPTTRGRVRDLECEGGAPPRLDADALLARLPGR